MKTLLNSIRSRFHVEFYPGVGLAIGYDPNFGMAMVMVPFFIFEFDV